MNPNTKKSVPAHGNLYLPINLCVTIVAYCLDVKYFLTQSVQGVFRYKTKNNLRLHKPGAWFHRQAKKERERKKGEAHVVDDRCGTDNFVAVGVDHRLYAGQFHSHSIGHRHYRCGCTFCPGAARVVKQSLFAHLR